MIDPEQRARLFRESAGDQWRSEMASRILRSTDDALLGRVAEVLGCKLTPKDHAAQHKLTWTDGES